VSTSPIARHEAALVIAQHRGGRHGSSLTSEDGALRGGFAAFFLERSDKKVFESAHSRRTLLEASSSSVARMVRSLSSHTGYADKGRGYINFGKLMIMVIDSRRHVLATACGKRKLGGKQRDTVVAAVRASTTAVALGRRETQATSYAPKATFPLWRCGTLAGLNHGDRGDAVEDRSPIGSSRRSVYTRPFQ
jgi:hypothetical protein